MNNYSMVTERDYLNVLRTKNCQMVLRNEQMFQGKQLFFGVFLDSIKIIISIF